MFSSLIVSWKKERQWQSNLLDWSDCGALEDGGMFDLQLRRLDVRSADTTLDSNETTATLPPVAATACLQFVTVYELLNNI